MLDDVIGLERTVGLAVVTIELAEVTVGLALIIGLAVTAGFDETIGLVVFI